MGTVSPIDDGLLDNLPGLLSLKLVVLDRKTIRRMKSGGETPVLVRCSRWIKDEWSWDTGMAPREEGRPATGRELSLYRLLPGSMRGNESSVRFQRRPWESKRVSSSTMNSSFLKLQIVHARTDKWNQKFFHSTYCLSTFQHSIRKCWIISRYK